MMLAFIEFYLSKSVINKCARNKQFFIIFHKQYVVIHKQTLNYQRSAVIRPLQNMIKDRTERHLFFTTTLVIQSPFFLPTFIRREEKRGRKNERRCQKTMPRS